jgi:L-iditol 2-dehydrogenase
VCLFALRLRRFIRSSEGLLLAPPRAVELELGAKEVLATPEDFVNEAQGRHPLVIEPANSPFGFRDAVRASRIGGWVVLVGISDCDAYALSASEARRPGFEIKFVRRVGDDFHAPSTSAPPRATTSSSN